MGGIAIGLSLKCQLRSTGSGCLEYWLGNVLRSHVLEEKNAVFD